MGMRGGGVPGNDLGHMDHLAWVSMTDNGPITSNLLLNGILDKRGAVPAIQEFLTFRPRSSNCPEQQISISHLRGDSRDFALCKSLRVNYRCLIVLQTWPTCFQGLHKIIPGA